MRKLWIGIYVFLLCLNSSVVNIKALDPEDPVDYEVTLEIDETVNALTGLFDEIGRFSKQGIAKIGKVVGTEMYINEFGVDAVRDVWRYGLINSEGIVLAEPIYAEISDYNEELYLVQKVNSLGEGKPNIKTEGLLSKLNGSIVLEPIYDYISDFSSKKMVFMNHLEINPNENPIIPSDDYYWKPSVFSNIDGHLTAISLPLGVNINDYDHFYPYEFEGYLLMRAVDRECIEVYNCTYYEKSWFIDAYGNKRSDFSFDMQSGFYKEGDTLYLAYQRKEDRSQAQSFMAVVKLRTVDDQLIVEPFISEDEAYTNIWIDNAESKIHLSKTDGTNHSWATYDFATQEYIYGSNQVLDSVENIVVSGFEDVEIKRSCALNDLNMWACSIDVRYRDGLGVLTSGTYVDHTVEFDNYIVLYKWENGQTYTNVLYHDQSGKTQLLSDVGFKGYVSFSGSNFIVVKAWSDLGNEISLIRLSNEGAEIILENATNAYVQSVTDYIEVGSRVDETQYQVSLFDASSGKTLLNDVYNFQMLREVIDGASFGVFSTEISSTPKVFMARDGVLTDLDVEANHIGSFDEHKRSLLTAVKYYDCVQSSFDEASQTMIEVSSKCYRHEQSLIDSTGHVLVRGASLITRYDEANVFITQNYGYNDQNQVSSIKHGYVYFDTSWMQESIRFESIHMIDFDPSSSIARVYSDSYGLTLIKNGMPLVELNALLAGVSDVGRFANNLLVYRKYNAENIQETFVANMQGETIQIGNVLSYSGSIIKNEMGYHYLRETRIDDSFGVELIPIEGLVQSDQMGLNYIAGSVYAYSFDLNGQAIFTIDLLEHEGVLHANARHVLDESSQIGKFACVYMDAKDKGLIRYSKFIDSNCDNTQVGLLNLTGDVVLPAIYHHDFKFYGRYIVASRNIDSIKKVSIFNFDGSNALQGYGFDDVYFDLIDFQFAPFIVLMEDYGSNLLRLNPDLSLTYLGMYRISDFGTSGMYEIQGNSGNDQAGAAIIDANDNTIIGFEQGYLSFMYDDVLKLISTVKFVDGQMLNSSMFDLYGNKLLPDEYTPEMKWDQIRMKPMIALDDRGFIKLLYNDPKLKQMRFESYPGVESNWVESRAQFNNYYDLGQKKIIYDKSIYYNDSKTVDGFYRVEQAVPSDRSEEALRSNYETYYFKDVDGVRQIFERKPAIYDALYNEIIPAGKYDYIDWDVTKPFVITQDQDCHFQPDGSGYCSILYGLVNKNGNEIIEPKYTSVQYLNDSNLYRFYNYLTSSTAYVSSLGELLVQGKYNYSYVHKGLNWLMLVRNDKLVTDVDDPNLQTNVSVTDIIDLNTHELILSDVYNLYNDKLNSLFEKGHVSVGRVPDTVELIKHRYYNLMDGQYYEYIYISSGTKNGIIDLNGNYILEPNYDVVEEVRLETLENYQSSANVISGYYKIGQLLDKQVCTYASVSEQNEIIINEMTCRDWNYGLYHVGQGIVIEPQYSTISDISTDGYALVYENGVPQELEHAVYLNGSDEPTAVTVLGFVPKTGLIDFYSGMEIISPVYDQLLDTGNTGSYQYTVPKFDKAGLIRMTLNNLNGLANEQGVVLDAQYREAYQRNGMVYAQLLDGSWEVRDLNRLEDVIRVVIDAQVGTLKSIEMIEGKIIAEIRVTNDLEEYSLFGVLNMDMSEFLAFEYSDIKYVDGLWYLEKYDPLFGTYPRAVMDSDGNFLIPFTDKYDSLSEYVGGYAIGQAGNKVVEEPTAALTGPSLLSMFFMDVHAEENEFVLEILDEQGKVVGDLSELYESATLLGEVDGVIRALVKKDGQYFIAKLVKTPIYGVKITGVELTSSSVTLKVRDAYQLIANVLPLDHTESKSMLWSSDDETVAVVDQNGLVKALGAGTTTIRLKVNQFEATAAITVQKQAVITPPNEEVRLAVKNFVTTIQSIDKPDVSAMKAAKEAFVRQLRDLKKNNSDYLLYLTPEEQDLYETKLQTYFGDQIDIRVDEKSLPLRFKGLLMNIDVEQLIKGKKIVLRINVEPRDSVDALKSYMEENQFDGTSLQVFDLNIEDENGFNLTEFKYPIEFTLALPEDALGLGELVLLHNHESEFSTVSVTLNVGYTYSFTVDKLSEFVLVSNSRKAFKPLEIKEDERYRGLILLLGIMGFFVVLSMLWFGRLKNKV